MKTEQEKYTKYEVARILGARALQISANAPVLLKISKEEMENMSFDPIKIAEKEFEADILPISIKRPMPKRTEAEGEYKEFVVKEDPIARKPEKPKEVVASEGSGGPEEEAEEEKPEKKPEETIEEATEEYS